MPGRVAMIEKLAAGPHRGERANERKQMFPTGIGQRNQALKIAKQGKVMFQMRFQSLAGTDPDEAPSIPA